MNRATLYHNVDKILKYMRDVRAPSSGDMFGQTREDILDLEITHCADWPLATKLWMERRALGTWVSDHPLRLVQGKYEHKVRFKMRDINGLLDKEGSRGPFNFAYIITRVIRPNDKVIVVEGDDETGRGEMSLFVSDADPWIHLLRVDRIVIAQCEVRHGPAFSKMHILRMHGLGELRAPADLAK